MRNRIYSLLAALLLCSIRLQAQTLESLAKGNGSPEQRVNGIVVTFSSFAEGRANAEGILRFNFSYANVNAIASYLINLSTGMYIGYVLVIERLPDSAKLKITIGPLPEQLVNSFRGTVMGKMLEMKWPDRTSYTPARPPSYPEPLVINLNDVVKIPLWVNAGTEWGVVGDEIRFAVDRPRPARDFTLDDVKFNLSSFRLIINGEVRSGKSELDFYLGELPAFYLPGKGVFVISIRPHEGYDFQKIGLAEKNKISFSYGGDKYEWVNRYPVLPERGGPWNLWVMLDSKFQPNPEALEANQRLSKGNCCMYYRWVLESADKPPSSKK
ncbi:MAG TPA: hypothetical protein VJ810_23315 [Blastocatellia bacterium]|nr:hypothetical protein [Blastocatellia bacterium]